MSEWERLAEARDRLVAAICAEFVPLLNWLEPRCSAWWNAQPRWLQTVLSALNLTLLAWVMALAFGLFVAALLLVP